MLHLKITKNQFLKSAFNRQDPKLGNELNQYFAPQIDGGYYFDAPTQSFVDEFEKDSRRYN
jgi:hypothetical protein